MHVWSGKMNVCTAGGVFLPTGPSRSGRPLAGPKASKSQKKIRHDFSQIVFIRKWGKFT